MTFWLRLIRDHTDAAVIPADRGITKDAVPPGEWRKLVAAGLVKLVNGRLTITKAGRLKMREDEDEDQDEELRAERRPEAEAWRQQERDEEYQRRNQ